MTITPEMVAAAMMIVNQLIQLAITHYSQTGEIPTAEQVLAMNATLQAKIDAEKALP